MAPPSWSILCFAALYFAALPLFVYSGFLLQKKQSIDWNSRAISATCIDPTSDDWRSSTYIGTWKKCPLYFDEGAFRGGCTPWGAICSENDDIATLCPLNYGGEGDGCRSPNLLVTLIETVFTPGRIKDPMYENQREDQRIFLRLFWSFAVLSIPFFFILRSYLSWKERERELVREAEMEMEKLLDGEGDVFKCV